MTMRTFHYAGVATVNVTQGLPRIIEIVDARKVPQTPTMIIYMDEKNSKGKPLRTNEKLVRDLAASIETTTAIDIATIDVDVAQRNILLQLNNKNMKLKKMTGAEVRDKLSRALRLYVQADDDDRPKSLRIIPGVSKEEDLASLASDPPTYTALLQLEDKIKKLRLKGLPELAGPQYRAQCPKQANITFRQSVPTYRRSVSSTGSTEQGRIRTISMRYMTTLV